MSSSRQQPKMNGLLTYQVYDLCRPRLTSSQLTSCRVSICSIRTCLRLAASATLLYRTGIIVEIRRGTSKIAAAKFWFNVWLIMAKVTCRFKLNNRLTVLKNTCLQKPWKNHKLPNYVIKDLTRRWLIFIIKDRWRSVSFLTSTRSRSRDMISVLVQVLVRVKTSLKILLY